MPELGWLAGVIDESSVARAEVSARNSLVFDALDGITATELEVRWEPVEDTERVLEASDLLAWDALIADRLSPEARGLAKQAFALMRSRPPVLPAADRHLGLLRTACMGWLADEPTLALRLLLHEDLASELADSTWGERVRDATWRLWLLLLRKQGWSDLQLIDELLLALRQSQRSEERQYLEAANDPAASAWQLAGLYHLMRAAEVLAQFLISGSVSPDDSPETVRFDPKARIQGHIDRALSACQASGDLELEDLCRLLGMTAEQVIENSLWSVYRAVSPLTRRFVESLVSRAQRNPIFELLPPQRVALAEQGLARSGQRSIVVSMPTSSGKTLIAEFRILQALTTFASEAGWVAYLAPTRALVNQVTRRLRRDFASLGIQVEKVSPALEIDGLEADLFDAEDGQATFDVLVATPEKLDLLLRTGWQERIRRPMSLVVVDEAHNLASDSRGLKLELLLATINREARDAAFLLLTPFVPNADQVAQWLDPSSNQAVELQMNWAPNDRIIALARPVSGGGRRGDYSIELETVSTTRSTLSATDEISVGGNRPLRQTLSAARSPGKLAAATAQVVAPRGATITLAMRPDHAWSLAQSLASVTDAQPVSEDVVAARTVIANEYGSDFPLLDLLARGIGVHHSGISDEVRALVEYLLEAGDIRHLIATTTVAQGVNFPVANVVLASHQFPYGQDMPAADFWNLAGRAGRVDQGQVGLIAFASPDPARDSTLRTFIGRNVLSLNSTLVQMVTDALSVASEIDLSALAYREEWSAFVQYLAHSYRQIGDPKLFASELEQVLRGTFGFQELRSGNLQNALELLRSVRVYSERLAGQPLALVDSTGFSLESVTATLARLSDAQIGAAVWDSPLFGRDTRPLAEMIGVMLQVPELRENLVDQAETGRGGGQFVASVVSSWVNGMPLREIADQFFRREGDDALDSLTRCCSKLFRDFAPTIAWGLSAMQAMTLRGVFDDLDPTRQRELRNVPSFAFYGVNTEAAVALRLLGVPRGAAAAMVDGLRLPTSGPVTESISALRSRLERLEASDWQSMLGDGGPAYARVWQILNGQ